MISRRQLLHFSALLYLCYPFAPLGSFAVAKEETHSTGYPRTLALLQEIYWAETIANKHYDEYCQKALSDSEKIHAESFKNILASLGSTLQKKQIAISSAGTKKNLNTL